MKTPISISVSPEIVLKLDSLAELRKWSRAQLVREIIDEYVKNAKRTKSRG